LPLPTDQGEPKRLTDFAAVPELVGPLVLILLAGTGALLAAALRARTLAELIVAAYVCAFAEIVVLVLALSLVDALNRIALVVGTAAVFGAAASARMRTGAPRAWPVSARPIRRVLRSGPVVVLVAAVTLAFSYVVALVVGTPPNNWDSLTYHLARAAFWRQHEAVGYIADAYDERLNANPPNGEIALTFFLELTRNEQWSGFVQLTAAAACAVGVFALARRLSLTDREAAFGALLFLTLPIVLLQASSTQNDLAVASLLVAATVLLAQDSRPVLILASVATALAIGTKVTALYALPILGAIAVLAEPRNLRPARVASVATGTLAGAYWYLVNALETGDPLGERPDTKVLALLDPVTNMLAAYARILDALDLSGAAGRSVVLYAVAAATVAVTLLVVSFRSGRVEYGVAAVAGAFALIHWHSSRWATSCGACSRSSMTCSGSPPAPFRSHAGRDRRLRARAPPGSGRSASSS
jgi:hypothetical protein